jgi:tetratricopeptide (TPR) repeat protein
LATRSTRAEALAEENGDTLGALGELRIVLHQQEELFGAHSAAAYRTLSRIASLAVAAGEPSAAIDAYQQLLPQSIAADDGKVSRGTALVHLHLADAYANAHRYELARHEWNEADGALTAIAGIDDVDARLARSGVAFALTRLGRIDDADPIFAALLARPFTQPMERLLIESRLAALRSAQGRHDEAEAILTGIAAQSPDGSSQRSHALALAELGYARVTAGRFSQALEVLQQGRELLSSQQPNGSPDLADIDVHIARAKLALGDVGEALAAAQRAVAYWQRVDSRNREHAVALLWQSRALAANHDAAGAEQSLAASADIFATATIPGDDAMIQRARALVASAHH